MSFLRPYVYRFHHGSFEGYKWVSGVPGLGSLLLALAAILLRDSTVWMIAALLIALIDTGGLHWFIGTQLWHEVIKPRRAKT
jgi:hypothetical protein